MVQKRLYLSDDKKICGVCGGIGEYLDIDPTLIRVGYLLMSICSTAFPGLLLYIILVFVIPKKPFS